MAKRQNLDSTITIGSALSPTFGRTMGQVKGGLRQIGSAARNAAVVIGGAAAGLTAFTTAQAGIIEETTQAANRIGVTSEELTRLGYVAGQFGVQNDALVDGLKELSLRADEFAVTGKGPASEAFARIGLSAKEAGELSKDTAELFEVVRDRMSGITDVAARQRLADELFGGTGGEQLIELLALGEKGYAALGEEAERAGAIITEDQTRLARELQQAQRRLGSVFDGMRNTLATELMPSVTFAFGTLSDYLIDNRDEIAAFAADFGDAFESALPHIGEAVEGFRDVAGVIGDAVSRAAELTGGFDNLTAAAGTFFAAKFIGAAFLGGPVGIAIGAVAAGIVTIGRNWDAVTEKFADAARSIDERFQAIEDRVNGIGDAVRDFFGGADDGYTRNPRRGMGGSTPAPDPSGLLSPGSYDRNPRRGASPASVNTTININGASMSVREVVDEIDRRRRASERMALFDTNGVTYA